MTRHRAQNRIWAAVCFGTLMIFATPAAAERSCVVTEIEGAEAKLWHEGEWQALGTDTLPSGASKVVTGADTRLRLTCADGVAVTIGADTEVNLEALAGPSGSRTDAIVELINGIIGIVAPERTWRAFEVRTPLAIASVRSTEWLVENRRDAASIFVRKGRVSVGTRWGRYSLSRRKGIDVTEAGGAGDVKEWSEERITAATTALGPGWR